MKTLFVKSIMLLVVIVGLIHYALYLKTGQLPWGDGWKGPNLPTPSSLPGIDSLLSVDNLAPSSKIRVYKWVDEHGVVNYSQEPPPANLQGQTLEVDSNVNIILGMPLPEPGSSTDNQRPRSVLLGEAGESAEAEKTPIEKAIEAKELLEARDLEQKKILDSL